MLNNFIEEFISFVDYGILTEITDSMDSLRHSLGSPFKIIFPKSTFNQFLNNFQNIELSIPKNCKQILNFDICQ